MRLLLFFFLVFAFCTKTNIAQNNQSGKYSVSFQPLQLLCRDLPITFERIHKKGTFGFTLGYRFGSKSNENFKTILLGNVANEHEFTSPRFNGLNFGLNSKYVFNKKEKLYFEAQLFYRHWWYNNRFYDFRYDGGSQPDEEYITTLRTNVIGTKLLVGSSLISDTKKSGGVLNCYFGLGCRIKYINENGKFRYSYDGQSGTLPYSAFTKKETKILPTFHAGFNLGLGIFYKDKKLK